MSENKTNINAESKWQEMTPGGTIYDAANSEEFKKEHSTIICRELLDLNEKISSPIPSKRTEEYYQERPCAKFIKTACEIISKEL